MLIFHWTLSLTVQFWTKYFSPFSVISAIFSVISAIFLKFFPFQLKLAKLSIFSQILFWGLTMSEIREMLNFHSKLGLTVQFRMKMLFAYFPWFPLFPVILTIFPLVPLLSVIFNSYTEISKVVNFHFIQNFLGGWKWVKLSKYWIFTQNSV